MAWLEEHGETLQQLPRATPPTEAGLASVAGRVLRVGAIAAMGAFRTRDEARSGRAVGAAGATRRTLAAA